MDAWEIFLVVDLVITSVAVKFVASAFASGTRFPTHRSFPASAQTFGLMGDE
jgi:hypothetical protein